jgi:hypothetical protein
MLFSFSAHGSAGILDELLLTCAPLLVLLIILSIASRRARSAAPDRVRRDHRSDSAHSPDLEK